MKQKLTKDFFVPPVFFLLFKDISEAHEASAQEGDTAVSGLINSM